MSSISNSISSSTPHSLSLEGKKEEPVKSNSLSDKIKSLFSHRTPAQPATETLSSEDMETLREALSLRNSSNGKLVYTDRDFICSPRWFKAIKEDTKL